jgi:alkylation response protein AidB-like acyl-CoA dehydrogenase
MYEKSPHADIFGDSDRSTDGRPASPGPHVHADRADPPPGLPGRLAPERRPPLALEATAAKAVAAENAFTVCDLGMQVLLGGLGYTLESPINRCWRRARLFRLAPISNEMAMNVVVEHLGMHRSF